MVEKNREKRAEPRSIVDEYHHVEFSVGREYLVYTCRIWNQSPSGMCIVLKAGSEVLSHIKRGDVLVMKYYKEGRPEGAVECRTKIVHVTRAETGRFKGHYKVGLLMLEGQ